LAGLLPSREENGAAFYDQTVDQETQRWDFELHIVTERHDRKSRAALQVFGDQEATLPFAPIFIGVNALPRVVRRALDSRMPRRCLTSCHPLPAQLSCRQR